MSISWYICMMEYYLGIKMNKLLTYTTTMDLKNITFSELSQTQKVSTM
jgi:hypothetical protein